jgi:hypothetical protein
LIIIFVHLGLEAVGDKTNEDENQAVKKKMKTPRKVRNKDEDLECK